MGRKGRWPFVKACFLCKGVEQKQEGFRQCCVDRELDGGGCKQLGVSQEVFGGEMGWSFKPFANFGCAEILGSTFVGCEG